MKIVFLLIAILAVESSVDLYLEKNNENTSFRVGRRILKRISDSVTDEIDIIIVGDSSCNAGIDVSVVTRETGLKAVKLAPPARYAQMSGYYFLKEHLKNNPPPKILLDLRSPSFMSTRWSPELFFDNFYNLNDCFEMILKGIIKPYDFLFDHCPNFFISFRNRFALKRILGEKISLLQNYQINETVIKNSKKIKKKTKNKRKIYKPYEITNAGVFIFDQDASININWFEGMKGKDHFPYHYKLINKKELNFQVGQFSYKFKNILYDNGLKPYEVAACYKRRLKFFNQVLSNNSNIITDIDRFYIEKIVNLCQQNNIDYYFLQGPLFEGLYTHKIGRSYYDKALIEFKKISSEILGFSMLSDDILLFPLISLSNSTEHLNTKGMDLYSNHVALMLNGIL